MRIPDIGVPVLEDPLQDDSLPPGMRRIVATLLLDKGRFISRVDRPASLLPGYHTPPPIQGSYWVRGDTIIFCESGAVNQSQKFRLRLQRDSLCLAYLFQADTLDSGATVVIVPHGCLPWHNAWMKHQGTFSRIGWPGRE